MSSTPKNQKKFFCAFFQLFDIKTISFRSGLIFTYIMKNKMKKLLQMIGFLLLGLLVSRFFLDENISIKNFHLKFDVIMHLLLIIGVFMMGFGKQKS